MGTYKTAQVCLNGHVITGDLSGHPELGENFCGTCGKTTIHQCTECGKDIRGYYDVPGVLSIGGVSLNSYCHYCGKPYPWTEAKLLAAQEMADELDELNADEKRKLKGTFEDLMRDSPRTEVAAVKFKKLIAKVGAESGKVLRDIIVDVASEAAKKAILGG